MTSTPRSVLFFVAGLLLGALGGCAAGWILARRGPAYELTEDVVLRHGGGTAPGIAMLRAGQRFDVMWRKADVNYLRVYVTTYDRDLAGHTRDANTLVKTNDTPWDNWAKWQQGRKPQ